MAGQWICLARAVSISELRWVDRYAGLLQRDKPAPRVFCNLE